VNKHLFLVIGLMLSSFLVFAQEEDDPFAPTPGKPTIVPIDSTITIKILARDTATLEYYALYDFEYKNSTKKVYARFMIPRNKDAYRSKPLQNVAVKFCRVTEFINSYQGLPSEPIEVEDYLDVTDENGKGKRHFNLDPSEPNPVLTICDATTKPAASK
jgi:hypothetical protein